MATTDCEARANFATRSSGSLVGASLPLRPPPINSIAVSDFAPSGFAMRSQCCQSGRSTSSGLRHVCDFRSTTNVVRPGSRSGLDDVPGVAGVGLCHVLVESRLVGPQLRGTYRVPSSRRPIARTNADTVALHTTPHRRNTELRAARPTDEHLTSMWLW